MLTIAAVERATGVSKDLLRAWERRYGFPVPTRDARGRRAYDEAQLQRLQWIRQLLALGHRPHEVVGLAEPALRQHLARSAAAVPKGAAAGAGGVNGADGTDGADGLDSAESRRQQADLWHCLAQRDAQALHALLRRSLALQGLPRFVLEVAMPCTAQVGQAWARGDIGVDQEHLYTEVMTALLAHATLEWPATRTSRAPRMLFTTVPGEAHGLGLRMAQALCAAEGASTLCLGLQTPLPQVAEAALAWGADVVALSFSGASSAVQVGHSLADLRALLPPGTLLWVGGRAAGLVHHPPSAAGDALQAFAALQQIAPAVRQLQADLLARGQAQSQSQAEV